MRIAIMLLITASLAYADERSDYIKALPKEQILATIEHLQRLTKDAIADKAAAIEQNQIVTTKLVEVQQANEDARRLAAQAEKEMTALREWGTQQQAEAAKQEARADKEAKTARHRGMLLGYICAALGVFIATTFSKLLPMPYSVIAPVAGAAIGFTAGRFLL